MALSPKQYVDIMRRKYPNRYSSSSDLEIYQDFQQKYPDKQFPTFNPVKQEDTEDLLTINTNPSVFEWLGTTSFITEGMIDEGFMGGSSDFYKDTYHKSLPGLVYKSIYGKDRYELDNENYSPTVLAQAGQFFLGLMNPMEIAAFGMAGLAAKPVTGLVSKLAMKGLSSGAAKKGAGSVFTHNIITGATEMGIQGGTYAAAHGAASSAAMQKEETGAINAQKVFSDAGHAFLEGGAMFALTGGIVKGSMGTLNAYATRKLTDNASFATKAQALLTGQVPQVGVEGAMIGALPTIFGTEGAASFGSPEFFNEIFKNTLIVGGMRMSSRLWNGGNVNHDALKLIDTELRLEGSSLKQKVDAAKNVLDAADIKGVVKSDVLRGIAEAEASLALNKTQSKKLASDGKKWKEIQKKFEDPEYVKKIQNNHPDVANDIAFIMGEGLKLNLSYVGAIKDLINPKNEARLINHFKEQFPKLESTKENLDMFRKILENDAKTIQDAFGLMNEVITGIPDATVSKKTRKKAAAPQKEKTILSLTLNETRQIRNTKNNKDKYRTEYNNTLERELKNNYTQRPNESNKAYETRIENLKKGYVLRENAPIKEIADNLFALKDNIRADSLARQQRTSAQISTQAKQAAQKTKSDFLEPVESGKKKHKTTNEKIEDINNAHEILIDSKKATPEQLQASSKFWGSLPKSKRKNIIDLKKNVNNKAADKNVNKATHKDNMIAVMETIISRKQDVAGGGGGKGPLDAKSWNTTKNLWMQLADISTRQGKSIFDISIEDISSLMIGLKKNSVEQSAMIKFLQTNAKKFTNKEVYDLANKGKELLTQNIKEMTDVVTIPTKGLLASVFLKGTKTGKFTIVMGKVGKVKQPIVSDNLVNRIANVIFANRKNKTSYKHIDKGGGAYDAKTGTFKDASYEFTFLKSDGSPITTQNANSIIKAAMKSKHFLEKVGKDSKSIDTSRATRKGFITWIQGKIKKTLNFDEIIQVADSMMLGHSKGIVDAAYQKARPQAQAEVKRLWKLYVKEINGKSKKLTKKERGTEGAITPQEIRELLHAIDTLDGKVLKADGTEKLSKKTNKPFKGRKGFVKIGNAEYPIETIKSLIEYNAQTSARPSETLPDAAFLAEIGYKEGFKKHQQTKEYQDQLKKNQGDSGTGTGGTGGTGGAAPVIPVRKQTKTKLKEDFQKLSRKQGSDVLKNALKELYDKMGISKNTYQKTRLKNHLLKIAGVGEKYKINQNSSIQELSMIYNRIVDTSPSLLQSGMSQKTVYRKIPIIERNRKKVNITEKDHKAILEGLGVKDGNIYASTPKQLETYEAIIQGMKPKKSTGNLWLDDAIAQGLSRKAHKTKVMNWLATKKMSLPVTKVFESIGLTKLSKRLYSHIAAELNHAGQLFKFEDAATSIIGKRKFNKIKEHFYLLDKPRYLERQKNGDLTTSEKAFIKNTIDVDTWKPLNTKTGRVVSELIKSKKYYENMFKTVMKKILNEAEYEAFKKSGNINWVGKDNIYIHRGLTKEFKEIYAPDGAFDKRIVEKHEFKIAKDMAIEKHKTSNPTQEQINAFRADAHVLAMQDLQALYEFNPGKYSTGFIKSRGEKLPEFMNIDGKKVKVYETSYDKTIGAYSNGMAKFLANIEFFPEYVSMNGFKMPGQVKRIERLEKVLSKDVGQWVDKKVKEHLNIEKSPSDLPVASSIAAKYASILAKLQLSFPTSGLKNLLVGNTQTVAAFKMRHYLMGFADAISAENRKMVRAMSATELGMRHFEEGALSKAFGNSIFKLGFMKPSENINRYISTLAGLRAAKEIVRVIQKTPKGSKHSKNAEYTLSNFFKLSDKDINLVKKYGINSSAIDLSAFKGNQGIKIKRQIEVINQKIGTMSHIGTQGASINVLMPTWASGSLAKSMILYKKMAFAAWENTKTNMNIAYKTGNPMAMAWFGLATYMSGKSMIWIYDNLLGQSMPHKHGDAAKKFQTTLWKGEFLGVLSEFLNPNGGVETLRQSFNPAIFSNVEVMLEAVSNVAKKKKFWTEGKAIGPGQMMDYVGRKTIGFYNGAAKILERGKGNKYFSVVQEHKKTHREFTDKMNEKKDFVANNNFMKYEMSPYLAAWRDVFHLGTEKEMARWYVLSLFSKAGDYLHEGRAPGIIEGEIVPIRNSREAFKQAQSDMKRSLTDFSPIKEIIDPKTGKLDISGKRQLAYLKYIAANEYTALKNSKEGRQLLKKSGGKKALWNLAFKKSKAVQELLSAQKTYNARVESFKKNFKKHYKQLDKNDGLKKLFDVYGIKYTI